MEDPRNDARIIETLKNQNKYRQGLSAELLSIDKLVSGILELTFSLTNHYSEALLILDPDKMGVKLFHYYTGGLTLTDNLNNSFTHNITPTGPNPFNSWENDWFTTLAGKETKIFKISYPNFENMLAGQYSARFDYPGLSFQVEKKNL